MPEGIDGKYGEITTERKSFHPGEPVFLLRATDRLAAHAIARYGDLCEGEGCSPEHVEAIYRHADRIRLWQQAHPHLVKTPD